MGNRLSWPDELTYPMTLRGIGLYQALKKTQNALVVLIYFLSYDASISRYH